jgi:hypothetical protein
MTRPSPRPILVLASIGLSLLLPTAPATAQPRFPQHAENPSHAPIAMPGGESDLARLLQERLRKEVRQHATDTDLLGKIGQLAKNMPPGDLLKLAEKLQGQQGLNDPDVQKLQALLKNNPGLQDLAQELAKDPQAVERLRQLQERLGQKKDEPSPLNLPWDKIAELGGKTTGPSNLPSEAGPPANGPPTSSDSEPRPAQPVPIPGEGPDPKGIRPGDFKDLQRPPTEPSPDEQNYRDMLSQVEKWFGKVGDSPGFQKTLRELEKLRLSPDERMSGPMGQLQDLARKAGESLEKTPLGKPKLSGLSGSLPKSPGWSPSLPSLPGGGPSLSGPNLGGNGASLEGAGKGMIGLVAAGLVLLVAALLLRDLQRRRAAAADGPAGLGPWPVDPARVADRGQLIQAFEYLGVKRGGMPARTWNHHMLADRLGATDPAHRAAAERLAELYAESRYAPAAAPLPPESLDEARRDLCLLAGVNPA